MTYPPLDALSRSLASGFLLALTLAAACRPAPAAVAPTPNWPAIERQRGEPSPTPKAPHSAPTPVSPTPEPLPDPREVGPQPLSPIEPAGARERIIPIGLFAQLVTPPCNVTLQSIVDATPTNGVARIPGCLYREQVTVPRAMTITGQASSLYARPVVKGSDVVTGWSGTGPWTKAGLTVFTDSGSSCQGSAENRCNKAEQVFYDGTPMKQRPDGTTPSAMQFSKSGSTYTIGSDPSGHTVEVTSRQHWFVIQADGVTIQGFTMQHAAPASQDGAIATRNSQNGTPRQSFTIQNSYLSHAHGALLSLAGPDNNASTPVTHPVVKNNDLSWGGDLCIHGTNIGGGLIQNNVFHECSSESPAPGYEAGAFKWTVSGGTATDPFLVDGNVVYHADGPGIWCDISCGTAARSGATEIEIKRNRIYDITQNGVFFEISAGALIHDNYVYNTGAQGGAGDGGWGFGAGILDSSSINAEIYNNTLAWNADGISIVSQDRSTSGGNQPNQPTGAVVHNNFIAQVGTTAGAADQYSRHALGFMQDWGGAGFNTDAVPSLCSSHSQNMNTCGYSNTYWYSGGSGTESGSGTPERYQCNFGYATLASMNASNCEDGATYASDATKDSTLSAKGIPTSAPSSWTPSFYP